MTNLFFINFTLNLFKFQWYLQLIMSKLTILVLGAVLLSAFYLYSAESQHNSNEFEQWKRDFGFKFTDEENAYRKMIFNANLEKINKHNQDETQTYKMGINQFTHLTQEEFVKSYLNPRPQKLSLQLDEEINPSNADIDWTTKGAISPVKDQGNCGSCWAFSAVATLESFALMKGQTVYLSEQQLVDCSRAQGNAGCNGGYNIQGLAYVKLYGIASSSQYPYVAKDQTCKMTGGSFKITNVQSATGCNAINNAIQLRPVGISADATNWSGYSSGVFNNCKTSINHDILLVGVTSTYWKIKNSWGKSWGENGFIRVAYGNTCGVCIDATPWPV